MSVVLPKLGWVLHKFYSRKAFNEVKLQNEKLEELLVDKDIIRGLERMDLVLKEFEERGVVVFDNEKSSIEDIKFGADLANLGYEYEEDWFSIDETVPNGERIRRKRKEIIKSISLIREHGHKKALEIRKKSLKNP